MSAMAVGRRTSRRTTRSTCAAPCPTSIALVDAGVIVAVLNRAERHHAAAKTGVREIWTLDSDFAVYRLPDRTRFKVIPGGKA